MKSRPRTALASAVVVGLGLLFTAGCGGTGSSSLNSGLLTTTGTATGGGTLTAGPDSGKTVTVEIETQQEAVVGTTIFSGTLDVNGTQFSIAGSLQSNDSYILSGIDPTNNTTYTLDGAATSATNLSGTASVSGANGDTLTNITMTSIA